MRNMFILLATAAPEFLLIGTLWQAPCKFLQKCSSFIFCPDLHITFVDFLIFCMESCNVRKIDLIPPEWRSQNSLVVSLPNSIQQSCTPYLWSVHVYMMLSVCFLTIHSHLFAPNSKVVNCQFVTALLGAVVYPVAPINAAWITSTMV